MTSNVIIISRKFPFQKTKKDRYSAFLILVFQHDSRPFCVSGVAMNTYLGTYLPT